VVYFPSAPLHYIQSLAPGAEVNYYDGEDPVLAAKLAATANVVILFAQQWTAESQDVKTLNLPNRQNALIAAVSQANHQTVVVLETGGPVLMPWHNEVAAIVEAWYPGTRGGEAIARILFGVVNPSGHLPVSMVQSEQQLVRPVLDGDPAAPDLPFEVNYREGAAVGYKWLDLQHSPPLFAFGFGLSYTDFSYSHLTVRCREVTCEASFTVTNTGRRSGRTVPQLYVSTTAAGWEAPQRLAGWEKVELAAGQHRQLRVTIDPRLLAVFDPSGKVWRIRGGPYQISLGQYAGDRHALIRSVGLPDSVLATDGQQQRN
jgi:beta-glucosidase